MSDRRRPDGATEPASRARSGAIGRRLPRTGTEPVTAQSPLRLRLLLSAVFLPLFVAGAAFFGVWAADTGPGDSPRTRHPGGPRRRVRGVRPALAAADLVVVAGRLRRERGAPAPH
ncbi:DUF6343 family protein [Streptomyces thinghirensis]|nr:DUF6343 family protein [Streptomyces thinghirensis]